MVPVAKESLLAIWTNALEEFSELTDDNIGGLPAELAHDPLEAGLLADLGGAVDVLHGEERAQPEQ